MINFENLASEYNVKLNEMFTVTDLKNGETVYLRFTPDCLQQKQDSEWKQSDTALSMLLSNKFKLAPVTKYKPKSNDSFYFVVSYLDHSGNINFYVQQKLWQGTLEDYVKFRTGNCFKVIPSEKTIQTMFNDNQNFYKELV